MLRPTPPDESVLSWLDTAEGREWTRENILRLPFGNWHNWAWFKDDFTCIPREDEYSHMHCGLSAWKPNRQRCILNKETDEVIDIPPLTDEILAWPNP